jgi:hypothetical protein
VKTGLNMEKDEDLKSLRGDPRFESLVAEARKHSLAVQADAPQTPKRPE